VARPCNDVLRLGDLDNGGYEVLAERKRFEGHLPHQRSGPPGLRIWKAAEAEPTRVLMAAREARREVNIFNVAYG
jgi:hypothetical protein